MRYDWDEKKEAANITKHGVFFAEAASVFDDFLSVTFADPDHSVDEKRLIILGQSNRQRLLFVSHTDRDGETRITSAREATRRERKVYEETS